MSANDQILGNAGGEEATGSGSMDGGDPLEQADTPAAENTADASSQSGDSDAASDDASDDDAEGSAPRPADPSIPPSNSAEFLTALPNELLHTIIADAGTIAYYSVRLSCKPLHTSLVTPPSMSLVEYAQLQRQFEAHSPYKPRNLYCQSCNVFKKSTPSRTTFTDAQTVLNLSGRRTCIDCGVANGHYDRRDVVIKKQKLFHCGGCKLLLAHDKEEKVITNVVFTEAYKYRDDGWGKGAEITIDSGGKRWCKPCRAAIANLGGSGAVKVKQERRVEMKPASRTIMRPGVREVGAARAAQTGASPQQNGDLSIDENDDNDDDVDIEAIDSLNKINISVFEEQPENLTNQWPSGSSQLKHTVPPDVLEVIEDKVDELQERRMKTEAQTGASPS